MSSYWCSGDLNKIELAVHEPCPMLWLSGRYNLKSWFLIT
ncbi:hypothetical protein VCR4J5_1310009 [Vibrio crassostreae]|uniref:Uncharacterized protein n=1 Tax=Vibrio crassostreae TaxID=246167 RepID=A0A822MMN5_9VIBR|nr:hypothetical protein VCR5J5_1240002 [Vibrio crassostreae]CDT03667.1 hypothetical protein VCR4J5_1310009 [Vibrio crassostreae]CDT51516.1 hypothetical protein VCR20J5_540002 [Vibrio crassostreae]CDT62375.1 hypothetical protein VCR19J5_70002 [Vibrio crassostreae]